MLPLLRQTLTTAIAIVLHLDSPTVLIVVFQILMVPIYLSYSNIHLSEIAPAVNVISVCYCNPYMFLCLPHHYINLSARRKIPDRLWIRMQAECR